MKGLGDADAVLSTLPADVLETLGTTETITHRTLAARTGGAEDTIAGPAAPASADALPHVTLAGKAGIPGQLDMREVLGTGGMGVVRLAQQRALEREVAVKTLHGDGGATAGASDLVREARITGQLEHPAVVPVHMLGQDARGQPLVVMKRIDGVTWGALARDPKHPFWAELEHGHEDTEAAHLRIFVQVCYALEFAHAKGVVHRDIKSENVMIGRFGEVHLLDWGIALRLDSRKEPAEPEVVGTPAFLAPEMLTGRETQVDERTDVFLLGATLFEVLTGRPRHPGRRVPAVLVAAMECEPPRFQGTRVAPELQEVIARATAKDPADRPQTVKQLRNMIAEYLEHRASLELTDRADAAAEDFETALGSAKADESLRSDVLTSFTRCRHGYWLAIDAWEENERARAGQRRVLDLMAGFYIETRQDEAAAALLAELGSAAKDERRSALEELREQLAAERRAQLELTSMWRELDPSIARRERMLLLLSLGVAAVVVTAVLAGLRLQGVDMMSPVALFGLAAAFAIAYGGGVFIVRKQVLKTKLNRRVVLGVGVLLAALNINRGVGLITGIGAELILVYDTLAFVLVTLAGAVTLDRRVGWMALIALPALFASAWHPAISQAVFPGVAMATIGGLILWGRRQKKSRKNPDASSSTL